MMPKGRIHRVRHGRDHRSGVTEGALRSIMDGFCGYGGVDAELLVMQTGAFGELRRRGDVGRTDRGCL